MKYKYQLVSYVVIFVVGYCSNFLLPISFFTAEPATIEQAQNDDVDPNKNIKLDSNNSINLTSKNKENSDVKSQANSSQIVASPLTDHGSQSSVSSEDTAALRNELDKLRDYRMQTEINKHNEYLKSRGGNSVEALSDSFRREPVDENWAKEKQNLINNLVDKSEHLSQIPHMASECRSTQCKLSVLSDDQYYLGELSNSLNKIVTDHESSFVSYSAVVDEKSHTTNIYFDRN